MNYRYTCTPMTDEENNLLEVHYKYEDRFENYVYKVIPEDLDMGAESRMEDVTDTEASKKEQVKEFQEKLKILLGRDAVKFNEEQRKAAEDCVTLLKVCHDTICLHSTQGCI